MTLAGAPHAPAGQGNGRAASSGDLGQLQHLISIMHHHAPPIAADERGLALMADAVPTSGAEQHLRAVSALLATLDTYLRSRRPRTPMAPRHGAAHGPAPVPAATSTPDAALAAATARYIARDLAARRLSEFTSAEGYRLARALARIGDVEASVERLLAEANTIRLHPPPLTDAVSHSAG